MNTIEFDDDLIILPMDPLEEADDCRRSRAGTSDLSTSDYHSIDTSLTVDLLSPIESNRTQKMSDITDLLDSSVLHDDGDNLPSLSTTIADCLRPTYRLSSDSNLHEHYQWQFEENCLKFGSKQLSPSDYHTRQSLYNRPVAFEKDSRSWARSLLNDFKTSNPTMKSKSSSIDLTYYFPMMKKSSSFDHHVQYIEHLNECNDYPAYLEYLRENRSQLFYTLTDSMDIIDGLIGTALSSY